MKHKGRKSFQIVLSITAWVLCALSSAFAYSFLSGMPWTFQARFLVGLVFMMAPLSVFWLITELFRKERQEEK